MSKFSNLFVHFINSIKINFLSGWRLWYHSIFCGLLVMYPIFVSDGQSWKFIKKYETLIPLNYKIHGIDVSRHNGNINWEKISQKKTENSIIQFIFIKATEGSDLVDQSFEHNWRNAKKFGFLRGAYHFFIPYSDPRLQALNFILNAKHQKGDFVPVLDFEQNGRTESERENMVKNVRIWLDIVEKHLGKKPIIYTNRPIYKDYIKGNLEEYPLWITDFNAKDLNGFDSANVILWQHSNTGRLEGINEDVDFNVFLGTPFKLNKFRL